MAVPVVLQHLYTLVFDWLTQRSSKDYLKLGVARSFQMQKVLYNTDGGDAGGNHLWVLSYLWTENFWENKNRNKLKIFPVREFVSDFKPANSPLDLCFLSF